MSRFLAFDFGGTRSRAALFDADLRLLRRAETLSRVDEGVAPTLQRLVDLGRSLLDDETRVAAIGIAAPGPLDPERGVIIRAHILPLWSNVPIGETISRAFGAAPCFVQNDANLGALAEYYFGAGRGCDPMLYLTISTGIGGGAIINGGLFTGARGMAIEPGHIRVPTAEGGHKRLEEVASGTALGQLARQQLDLSSQPSTLRDLPFVDGQAVGEAALAGDALAREIVHDAGAWLGLGLVNLLHLFNPAAIVMGGGVSQLGDLLLDPAREVIGQHILHDDFYAEGLLRRAALGDDICLVGAAQHAKNQRER